MRTWAHWTARTVMLAATFATAGAGVSAAAFAASGGGGGSTSGLELGAQAATRSPRR